jgi:hypothetical protein
MVFMVRRQGRLDDVIGVNIKITTRIWLAARAAFSSSSIAHHAACLRLKAPDEGANGFDSKLGMACQVGDLMMQELATQC